jgi:hypothetical protein
LSRSISNVDEFVVYFDQYNLNCVEYIKSFDPNHFFMDHMKFVGFRFSLANSSLFVGDEGDNQDPQKIFVEKKLEDIETAISTIGKHKQRGIVVNERSTLLPNASQRSDP